MPFAKIPCEILNSSLWDDADARIIFLTAVFMAEPREYLSGVEQISVRSLDLTGWATPAGWYGLVPAAGLGIIRRAGVDVERGLAALERLGDPDPQSRSKEHEGRRLIRVDGGFLVLNFQKYRDRDYSSAERSRRYRERQASRRVTRDAVTTRRDITQEEVEVRSTRPENPLSERQSRSTKEPHLFDVASDAYRLAELLLQLIRQRDPKAKGDAQQWARDIDGLLRLDGRDAAEVEHIIRWSQADPFWNSNILSAKKLRKQFSALLLKSKAPEGNRSGSRKATVEELRAARPISFQPAELPSWQQPQQHRTARQFRSLADLAAADAADSTSSNATSVAEAIPS